MNDTSFASEEVLEFYRELPFNYRESIETSAEVVAKQNPINAYPGIGELITPKSRVLDVGCGAGWLSNSISHHYGCAVTGIDFNSVAIERGTKVAEALKLPTQFMVQDLFLYRPEPPFDLVISLGVLHHTNNCEEALRRVGTNCVSPGGYFFVGLYHKYGRAPFLAHFENLKQKGYSEEQLFQEYKSLHSNLIDDTMAMSWFRDQVLHPHETQHTLQMVCDLFAEIGVDLISTSINRFGPISSHQDLFTEEKKFKEIGEQKLKDRTYFPGFFVALGRKRK